MLAAAGLYPAAAVFDPVMVWFARTSYDVLIRLEIIFSFSIILSSLHSSILGIAADNSACCILGRLYNGNCYEFNENRIHYQIAGQDCLSKGGQLAELKTADVRDFVYQWLVELNGKLKGRRMLRFAIVVVYDIVRVYDLVIDDYAYYVQCPRCYYYLKSFV